MSKTLTLRLLGTLSIEIAGRPVSGLGTRKAEALLVYLVCHQRPFPREFLADLLWDDRDPKQALANLRSLLSGMRRKLKPYLTITRQTIAFNHDSDTWLDVAAFTQLLEPDAAGDATDHLEEAVALYRGDFLEGFYLRDCRGFEEWVMLERERYQRQAIHALRRLVRRHLNRGNYRQGLRFADQLLKLDDLSERAHRYKMILLARSGQFNTALRQYDAYRQLLADELGVEPTYETTTLYERIRRARAAPPPPLPAPDTPFIGRSREIASLQDRLLNPECRLITLLGPGGIGKTSLALATARRISRMQPGLFLNGIFSVPLTGLSAPRLLPGAIAEACGCHFEGKEDHLSQLIDFLRRREMLLILDNFEHLLDPDAHQPDGAEIVQQLLANAPLLKLLITSRERLHLREEWVFDLGGLDYPEATAVPHPDRYSALQLFTQTAVRLQRHFQPDDADLAAVARVCRLLEGWPLGIELAAAWIRKFTCPQIADQIQADVDFLSTRLRNVPPRHRSVTAVFNHSWDLLPPAEQAVFARLALFRGDFDAEAAAAVAGADAAQLARLVDKSLLRRSAAPDRYDMHEMLRQFAAEKLAETEEAAEETAVRHTHFYLNRLIAQGDGDEPGQRRVIRQDLPDIRAAWNEAARRRDHDALLRAAPPWHSFHSAQSWFQEGIDAFQFALHQLDQQTTRKEAQAQVRCELLSRKARLHLHVGQLAIARQDLQEAMIYMPLVQDPERHAVILGYMAITHLYAGDFTQAAALAEESLKIAEAIDDVMGVGLAHSLLGSCAKSMGDYRLAQTHFAEAAATYRRTEDELGVAMALNNLGNVAQATGDYTTAQTHYLECSRIFKAHDHTHGAATTLANAGKLALKLEDYEGAAALLAESLALKRQMQDVRGTAVALSGLGDVAVATGESAQATAHLTEALALSQQVDDVKLTLEILGIVMALAFRQGEADPARRLLTFIQEHQATAQEVRDYTEALRPQITAVSSPSPPAESEPLTLATAVALADSLLGTQANTDQR